MMESEQAWPHGNFSGTRCRYIAENVETYFAEESYRKTRKDMN